MRRLWRWLMRYLGRGEMTTIEREARFAAAAEHDRRAREKADRVLQRHEEILATYRAADGRLDRR